MSFEDGENLIRNLSVTWQSSEERLGVWRFSALSPRTVKLRSLGHGQQQPQRLRCENYGDGSDHPVGVVWFLLSEKVALAQFAFSQYSRQLNDLASRTGRCVHAEIGDGHCGFWVIVRQLRAQIGLSDVDTQDWFPVDSIGKKRALKAAHGYLAGALRTHAEALADMEVQTALDSDMVPFPHGAMLVNAVESDEEDHFEDPKHPNPRCEERQIKLKKTLLLDLNTRSADHLSEGVAAVDFLPSRYWFGGLEYSDARAIAMEARVYWYWIVEGKTEVVVISPTGEKALAEMDAIQPTATDVISTWSGCHFTSIATGPSLNGTSTPKLMTTKKAKNDEPESKSLGADAPKGKPLEKTKLTTCTPIPASKKSPAKKTTKTKDSARKRKAASSSMGIKEAFKNSAISAKMASLQKKKPASDLDS